MTIRIGTKEIPLTDYLSASQFQKALHEAYEQGRADERKHIISLMDGEFDMNGKIKVLMDYIIGAELKWEYKEE